MERVGIYNEKIYCNWSLNNHEDPVYPDVKRILELKWGMILLGRAIFPKKHPIEWILKNIFWNICVVLWNVEEHEEWQIR